jgi:hypothetical protein
LALRKPPAVAAQQLNCHLRRYRATRNQLLRALQGIGGHVWAKGLRHALPNKKQRDDDRDRQHHVKRDPCDIDPEIADCRCGMAGETAHQGDCDRDACRTRQK